MLVQEILKPEPQVRFWSSGMALQNVAEPLLKLEPTHARLGNSIHC
jgi:hypothetical protein